MNSISWSLGWKYRAGQALKPETSRPDKHVVACMDIAGDWGSTPLASNLLIIGYLRDGNEVGNTEGNTSSAVVRGDL